MYIVLPTESILSRYETVDGLFSFMSDGVKSLIIPLILDTSVSVRTITHRIIGLTDIIKEFDKAYSNLDPEELNYALMDILPILERMEKDINKLISDFLPNEKLVIDDSVTFWVGGDVLLKVL